MKKASLSFPVVLIYGIIASLGFFDSPVINNLLKLAAFLPLAGFTIFHVNRHLREERPSDLERISLGLLLLIVAKSLFLYLTSAKFDSFPLDVLILVALAARHPLSNAMVYTAVTVIINLAHGYFTGEHFFDFDNLYRACGLLSTVGIVGRLLQKERTARVAAEGRLEGIESLANNIAIQAKDRKGTSLAISEGDKERLYLDFAGEVNSSIGWTLETISSMTGAYSCCLFTFKDNSFVLSSVVSKSKRLIYEIPREKGNSFITWIDEYDRSLCIDRLPDFRALGYYSEDVGVKYFLGVPVTVTGHGTKSVLCIDRKDTAFTKDEENLLILAAAAITVFLKNSTLISRMRDEAMEFSVFYQMVKKLSTTLVVDDILNIAMNFSKEIKEYDLTAIALKDDNGGLKFMSARGEGGAVLLKEDSAAGGKEFLDWVMEKGVPHQALVSRMEKKFLQKLPKPLEKMGSFLCIPLTVSSRSIGLFITARNQDTAYSPYELKLFEALCAHVSVAVSNAMIYRKMKDMATKDGLTGLYNFRSFQERLSYEIERGGRYNQGLALILLDIDFFKKVNDTYGHPAGDKVLKGISSILASSVREVDLAARYGGEEFGIILINSDAGHAYTIAERIRARIEAESFDIGDGKKLKVTSSMGIAAYPDDSDNQRLLISNADSALYRAKKEGRNRVYLYSQHSSKIS